MSEIEIITDGGRRRRWPAAEKLRIVEENQHCFTSIAEAGEIIEDWRIDYNTERPHSSLKYQTPEEFAVHKTQWVQTLGLFEGSVPAPIAHAAK